MTKSARKKRKFKIIYNGNLSLADEDDIYEQSFYKLTPEEKLKESWKMVEYAWKLKGRDINELRFDRTVAMLKRI